MLSLLVLHRIQIRFRQHTSHTHHAVNRRAQFVTNGQNRAVPRQAARQRYLPYFPLDCAKSCMTMIDTKHAMQSDNTESIQLPHSC